MRQDTLLLVSPAPEGTLRLAITGTYSVAGMVLGAFIRNIFSSRPAHSNPARKAVMSPVLATTLNSEPVSGGIGVLGKCPPTDSTLLSTKDSCTLVKPQNKSVK